MSTSQDKCLELTVELWNEFQTIENKHPDDNNEFRLHIHAIQNILYTHKYKMEVKGSDLI